MKSEKPDAGGVRLQKILSTAGVASRRASEQLIVEGRVTVNGAVVRELGSRADPARDDIRVDGRRIRADVRHRYILLYKPRGYVTTRSDPEGRPTVLDLMGRHVGYIYPVGRLDYDTEGLLLMTTDGALAEELTHPRHEVERVYEVIVAGAPDEGAIEKLRRGVYLDGRRTSAAEIRRGQTVKSGGITTKLTITLYEGRNRQVRRMCQAVGHPVRSLTRVSMGPLSLGRLRPGEWRELSADEVAALRNPDRPERDRRSQASDSRREEHGPRTAASGARTRGTYRPKGGPSSFRPKGGPSSFRPKGSPSSFRPKGSPSSFRPKDGPPRRGGGPAEAGPPASESERSPSPKGDPSSLRPKGRPSSFRPKESASRWSGGAANARPPATRSERSPRPKGGPASPRPTGGPPSTRRRGPRPPKRR